MTINDYIESKIPMYEKKFGVTSLHVMPSKLNTKRFTAVFEMDGKMRIRHFGDTNAVTYGDDNKLVEKRRLFRARHSKIKNKNGYAYMTPGSASSLSYYLLW